MRIALLGAGGRIGSRILAESGRREHRVTAVFRRLPDPSPPGAVQADAADPQALARAIAGHDTVISAIGPGRGGDPGIIERVAESLMAALPAAGVTRLMVVGGAGTLELEPGVMRLDAPGYPEQYRASGLAQKRALELCRASALDWTYVSPPIVISPGERTGHYQVGGDAVLYDAGGVSRISMEDYAVALLDILEAGTHRRERITVGY
jgi:putative NADH-flavin reductase